MSDPEPPTPPPPRRASKLAQSGLLLVVAGFASLSAAAVALWVSLSLPEQPDSARVLGSMSALWYLGSWALVVLGGVVSAVAFVRAWIGRRQVYGRKMAAAGGAMALLFIVPQATVVGLSIGLIVAALGAFMAAPRGRPFRTGLGAGVAGAEEGDGWREPLRLGPTDLSLPQQRALGEAWLRDAAAEHASVATFARLSLELMALGAPAALVEAAHVAALDEVRHARRCFGIAGALLGAPVAPGPWAAPRHRRWVPLERLAAEALVDGCLMEAHAAAVLERAAEGARDPALASVLEEAAADEARHAALAWDVVAWALAEGGPGVRAALRAAASLLPRRAPDDPAPDGLTGEQALAGGRVPCDLQRDLFDRCRVDVRSRVASMLSA